VSPLAGDGSGGAVHTGAPFDYSGDDAPRADAVASRALLASHSPSFSVDIPRLQPLVESFGSSGSPWDKLNSGAERAKQQFKPRHIEGWMAKQGHFVKNWKTRWFVLQGRRMSYFANQVRSSALLSVVACA
jgi:hypothetical protein